MLVAAAVLAVLGAVLPVVAVAVLARANPGVQLPLLGWPPVRPRLTTVSLGVAAACAALAYGTLSGRWSDPVAGLATFGPVLACFVVTVTAVNRRRPPA